MLELSRAESLKRHTDLIASLLAFIADVADHSNLTLDPEIDSFYLMDTMVKQVPESIENIGRLRATGMSILARRQITEEERQLMIAYEAVSASLNTNVKNNLGKATKHSHFLGERLSNAEAAFSRSLATLQGLVKDEVVTARFTSRRRHISSALLNRHVPAMRYSTRSKQSSTACCSRG